MKTMNFFIFTLIMFNLLHFFIHASHEKEVEICYTVTFEDSKIYPWGVTVNFSDVWTEWKILKVYQGKQADALGVEKYWRIISVNDEELSKDNWKQVRYDLLAGKHIKIKFATKTMKSIWLIRHAEKDRTKQDHYHRYKEQNYEWELSQNGVKQARRIAKVLKEKYKNHKNYPHIFVSPFKRTIHTGLYVSHYVNSRLKIEEGLLEKHHGLWDRAKMFNYFAYNISLFDMDYKSRFPATQDIISPFRWELNDAFDKNVAQYFVDMLHKGNQDIIIIGHQTELYNIQRAITGLHEHSEKAFNKIEYASMFQYTLNPKSLKLELKSYHLKGLECLSLPCILY